MEGKDVFLAELILNDPIFSASESTTVNTHRKEKNILDLGTGSAIIPRGKHLSLRITVVTAVGVADLVVVGPAQLV